MWYGKLTTFAYYRVGWGTVQCRIQSVFYRTLATSVYRVLDAQTSQTHGNVRNCSQYIIPSSHCTEFWIVCFVCLSDKKHFAYRSLNYLARGARQIWEYFPLGEKVIKKHWVEVHSRDVTGLQEGTCFESMLCLID